MFKKVFDGVVEVLILSIATFIIGFGVYFFLMPSHASVSSVSGLAIMLTNVFPLSVSALTMIMNVLLLIVAFLTLGNEFGAKTVYTSILLPVILALFEKLYPNFTSFTNSAELDVVVYVFLVSLGASILFNRNASSGGLDIVAKLLNKYLHMELGSAMTMAGMLIALSSFFFYDVKTVILSILGTYLNGIVLDHFIFGQTIKKKVCILSMNPSKVRDFIVDELHSGATLYDVKGGYNHVERQEVVAIVNRNEYRELLNWILSNDPSAFVTVYNVADIRYMPKKVK